MSNRGFTAIEDVWEFLHAFVVEAARAGEDLGQGWKFQGRDVTGLVKELYDRNTENSNYGRLNEWSVTWSLGIDHRVLKRIIKGWDNYHLGGSSKLSEWVLLGRKLRLAHHDALENPGQAVFVPWLVRPATPAKVVKKLKRRISTIDEVWDFLHSFVVHAAQHSLDLVGPSTGNVEEDEAPRLFHALLNLGGEPPKECQQWMRSWSYDSELRVVQYFLGLANHTQLRWIAFGWNAKKPIKNEWGQLGRHLFDAYSVARLVPDRQLQPKQWPPLPLRQRHNCWVYDADRVVHALPLPEVGELRVAPQLSSEGHVRGYRWVNEVTTHTGVTTCTYSAQVAAELDLAEHLRKMLTFMGAT